MPGTEPRFRLAFTPIVAITFIPLLILGFITSGVGHGSYCLILPLTFPWFFFAAPFAMGNETAFVIIVGAISFTQWLGLAYLLDVENFRIQRWKFRISAGLCPKCSLDLRQVTAERCPQCNIRITRPYSDPS